MDQSTLILLVLATLLVGWLIMTKQKEHLIPPWKLQQCRSACSSAGQELPWDGGDPRGPWEDPANVPSSNFDVGGCMARCDLNTWYGDQY